MGIHRGALGTSNSQFEGCYFSDVQSIEIESFD